MDKVAIVSTVKATPKELSTFVNYHLNIGIDLLILFFDDPFDPLIDQYDTREHIKVIVCDRQYWVSQESNDTLPLAKRQIVNANEGLKIAREHGCKWLIHIDSDEFLEAEEPLHRLLSKNGSDVVRFDVQEAIPTGESMENPYTDITGFRRSVGRRRWLCRLFLCPRALFSGSYFRGHVNSKIAFRTNMDVTNVGIHNVFGKEGHFQEISLSSIRLLHFDSVTFEDWKHKWALRSETKELNPNARGHNRHQQFLLYRRFVYDDTQLRKAYRRLYLLTGYERIILRMLGMFRLFQFNPTLFSNESHIK